MRKPDDRSIYYDFTPILSRGALLNFVVGGRGMGKTFGAKSVQMNDCIKRGHEFMYVRRYTEEMKEARDSYFNDVAPFFPEHDFRVNHGVAEYKHKDTKRYKTAGYFVALSTASKLKSVPYPKVRTILYDEFLVGKGFIRYLPNEVNAFFDLINSVDRYQDRVRAILLANSVDIANPYFLYFGIIPHPKEMRRYNDGLVAVDFPDSTEYSNWARQSRLGRLIDNTLYGDMALDNDFVVGANAYIAAKPSTAEYMMSIIYDGSRMSLWMDLKSDTLYVSGKYVRDDNVYILTMNEVTDDAHYILNRSDRVTQRLVEAYRGRRMFFSSDLVHAQFRKVLAFLYVR